MRKLLRIAVVACCLIAGAVTGAAPPPFDMAETASAAGEPVYDPNGPEGTVYRLYRAYFLREPDQGGFQYWLGVYRQGYPLEKISNDFARSEEFQQQYGNLDDRQFLDRVYQNVLSRNPDQDGYDYWLDQMNRGMLRGFVMIYFSDSAEFRSKTAHGVPPGYRSLIVRVEGRGNHSFEIVLDRPTIARTSHDGDGYFGVTGLDANGEFADLAANTVGAYEGERYLDSWADIRWIEVEADGNWVVELVPLNHAHPMDIGNGAGSGDAVRAVSVPETRQVRIRHSGSSGYFGVLGREADGSYGKLLANTSGPHEAVVVVPARISYLMIQSEGNWSFSNP